MTAQTDEVPEAKEDAWRKALRDAADYIEQQGWAQYPLSRDSRGGPVGIVSAVTTVCVYSKPYARALAELKQMLRASPMEWNERPGRTQDEAVLILRLCAERPDPEPQPEPEPAPAPPKRTAFNRVLRRLLNRPR